MIVKFLQVLGERYGATIEVNDFDREHCNWDFDGDF